MKGRAELAWQENRFSVPRRSKNSPVDPRVASRPFGGLPLYAKFGDCHQLGAVGKKGLYDDSKSRTSDLNCADAQGALLFKQLLRPLDEDEEVTVVVVMDETHRQDNQEFLDCIQQMRDGEVTRASAELLFTRILEHLPEEEQKTFEKEALYAMPTWKDTVPVTVQYLKDLKTPVARVDAKFSFKGINHAIKDIRLPVRNALAKGAIVMLLVNFVVEEGLFNGAVGIIVDIVYENSDGPREAGAQPAYVVVDFPDLEIPEEDVWDTEHPTFVPIPTVTLRCDKGCCTMTTIPLCVCKAITIHKCQGMTVGEGQVWKKIIIMIPKNANTPGLEQVAVSRAKGLDCIAILDNQENPLTKQRLMNIGRSPAYGLRRKFEKNLRDIQSGQEEKIENLIAAEDTNTDTPSFEGGFQALIAWYRSHLNDP